MTRHETHWTTRAACAGRLDLPWTRDAADVNPWQAAIMRALCDNCPALFDCLNAVDDLDVTGGWWAGADRDPNVGTAHLAPPAWATGDTSASALVSTSPVTAGLLVAWVPVRGKRGGVLAEQAAFTFDGLAGAGVA